MFTWLRKIFTTVVLLSLSCFAFADPPAESGVVVRYDDFYGNFWFDFDNGWSIYQGTDLYGFCAGAADFDTISIMEVFMRGDGHRYKNHYTGDLYTTVWPGIFFPDEVCAQILFGTGQPIATGMARVVWNDNDVEPWLNPDRHNMNTVGFKSNGTLYDFSTGERMNFMMYWHALWDGQDPSTFRALFKCNL